MKNKISVYDQNHRLVDVLLLFLNFTIKPETPFFPVFTIIDNKNYVHIKLIPLNEGDIDFEKMCNNQREILNQQLEKQEITSFAIAHDSHTNYKNKIVDTISITVINQNKDLSGYIQYDYKISKTKKFEISNFREQSLEE